MRFAKRTLTACIITTKNISDRKSSFNRPGASFIVYLRVCAVSNWILQKVMIFSFRVFFINKMGLYELKQYLHWQFYSSFWYRYSEFESGGKAEWNTHVHKNGPAHIWILAAEGSNTINKGAVWWYMKESSLEIRFRFDQPISTENAKAFSANTLFSRKYFLLFQQYVHTLAIWYISYHQIRLYLLIIFK